MSKIRRLYFFDKKNTQEMISFLNNSTYDTYITRVMFNPFIFLHHLIPLRFKYLPESYILKDKKQIKGLITVAPTRCPLKRMEIQKLFFEENCYEYASELLQFAISKYKAMGTASFIVKIDDYLPDLIKLFVSKCGFNQISYEKLWRINHVEDRDFSGLRFRTFRNSDAPVTANLYQESLLPHFRPLLGLEIKEFKDVIFRGLSYINEYKYVLEDKKTKNISAVISIKTSDNENYVMDVINSHWEDIDINTLISFANQQIRKRKKRFGLFIRTKKYTQNSENIERILLENGFECVQNQAVLTNSSAKIIKENSQESKYTVLGQFYGGNMNVQGY